MTDKSYVTMEQNICPVCGITHETGNLLLDKRLRDNFERCTVTGFTICADCQDRHDDGYLARIEIDDSKSNKPVNPESVWRTGKLAHLKYEVAKQIFDTDVSRYPFIYVEIGLIAQLLQQSES